MRSLPSGIVAFLLTDVEASTQAWNRSTDETEAALIGLDLDLTAKVTALDGSVVKARGEGDSHLAVFSEASRAISYLTTWAVAPVTPTPVVLLIPCPRRRR
jgi:class 3 adenylate cyclase